MGAEELLLRVINKSHRQKAIRTIGMGTASQITENNCVVLRDGQPELHDVRFHATEAKPGSRVTEIPAAGSSVIYAIIENQATEAVILKCGEIERVIIEVADTKYQIDADGYLMSKGSESMKKILEDLIKVVQGIIVINGRGPSIPELTAIKNRLKTFFKQEGGEL